MTFVKHVIPIVTICNGRNT